jgi:3-oxoacyl-[acyl-carrier-protein] synthase III
MLDVAPGAAEAPARGRIDEHELRAAGIAAIGAAVPRRAVANDAIGERLGVDGEWISTRTGVHERRVAAADATLTDLAVDAAGPALERAGIAPAEVDLVLVATSTPDEIVPNAAPLVADAIGASRAGAIDIGAACTGFVSALDVAAAAVEAGRAEAVLAIGAELMSRVIDYDDKRTAGLFGDGAGAAVVVPGGRGAIGPIRLHADGSGSRNVTASHAERKIRMDGRATFRAAVARLSEVTLEVAADAGLTLAEIDLFVYHQANSRILSSVGERLELPSDRVVDSLALYGNTSAASIPIALDAALRDGRLRDGATVLVAAFGAGLTWGAGIVEWGRGR